MTTTANPKNPLAEQKPVEYKSVSIPLAEFGKSLADVDLDDWFEAFAERNSYEGQTYEISGTGYLLIMPPTGSPGDIHELNLAAFLWNWARIYGGIVRGPTTRFHLPDGSRPGPDASWVAEDRKNELMLAENRPFTTFAPDFVAEIKSPSNSDAELVDKINLLITYGTRLGWLIDAETRTVIIFRPGRAPETLHDPEFVDGDEDVLPGFSFPVRAEIFDHLTNPQ